MPTTTVTPNQKKLIFKLTTELKLALPQTQFKRFKTGSMSRTEASRLIDGLLAVQQRQSRASDGARMCTAKQIAHYATLCGRLHQRLDAAELSQLTTAEMAARIQTAERAIQDMHDAEGRPIPQWRYRSGLYTEEVLARCGVEGLMPPASSVTTSTASAPSTLEELENLL